MQTEEPAQFDPPPPPGTKQSDYLVIVPEGVEKGEKFTAEIGGKTQ
jgi:hypothetical protein